MQVNMLSYIFLHIILTVYSHPDENLTIKQIISKHNYPVEEHTIETSDGYLLKTFRIPHGKYNQHQSRRVVLLVHGLASSADDWIILGQDALAYFLADSSFDVWLFNARGTHHSRKHKTLDPDRDAKEFWNFCWQEIGTLDIPANINYILNQTNTDKLFYVGHSQGGTSCLVMLSVLPEMNNKIIYAVLLAPAAYFLNVENSMALRISSALYSPATRQMKFYEFPPKTSFLTKDMTRDFCSNPGFKNFCYSMLYFGTQLENHLIDQELVPLIVQHTPTTFSTKQVHHYVQIMQSGEFRKFDYGEKVNLRIYGFSKPPLYNLSEIVTPMAVFYGNGDSLVSPMSIKKIGDELRNKHILYKVPYDGFGHLDFLWARNTKKLVYEKAYEIISKHFG